jgi:hypothetical protein
MSNIKVLTIREENEEFENLFNFKPSGVCNYLCSIYNNVTHLRTIIGDGGVCLDEFFNSDLPRIFFNSYIIDKNDTNKYILSIILPDSNTINYIVLNSDSYNKKKLLKEEFKKFNDLFDKTFALFIKDDNRKGRPYRADSPIFKKLVDGYNKFKEFKLSQKETLDSIMDND